jgi:hypothetical protein
MFVLHVTYIDLTFLLKPSLLTETGLKPRVYITGYKLRQFIFIIRNLIVQSERDVLY